MSDDPIRRPQTEISWYVKHYNKASPFLMSAEKAAWRPVKCYGRISFASVSSKLNSDRCLSAAYTETDGKSICAPTSGTSVRVRASGLKLACPPGSWSHSRWLELKLMTAGESFDLDMNGERTLSRWRQNSDVSGFLVFFVQCITIVALWGCAVLWAEC